MTPELKQFIEQARFYKASVLRVAEMLPAEDAALDELIAEVVRDGDQKAFMLVVVAALSRERSVDARHLARGAMMLPQYQWFPLVRAVSRGSGGTVAGRHRADPVEVGLRSGGPAHRDGVVRRSSRRQAAGATDSPRAAAGARQGTAK